MVNSKPFHSVLSYQNDKKVHELTLFLKIPLIFEGVKRTVSKNVQKKNLLKLSKTLTDQPNTRSDYSTVEENSTLVNSTCVRSVLGNNITSDKTNRKLEVIYFRKE